MATSKSSDDLVFDYQTLRLIIGALAFAFPSLVLVLSGKVTTSISASYYEPASRNIFVGFLFIIGGLLISYKGHLLGEPRQKSDKFWHWLLSFKWLKTYQEDLISTLGGSAAIFTALYPTACDGCPMDTRAKIHMTGAFILFSMVVYFCLIAFLRSLNQKLLKHADLRKDKNFRARIRTLRKNKLQTGWNPFRKFWTFLSLEAQTFLAIAGEKFTKLDPEKEAEITFKVAEVFKAEIKRGKIYVACGAFITVTLLVYLVLAVSAPGLIATSKITFIIETIALVLFGFAWITASKLSYFPELMSWLQSGQTKKATTP
ncbi:MAG: hypothetical protein ABI904_10005 [Chloroflexota bacterium]